MKKLQTNRYELSRHECPCCDAPRPEWVLSAANGDPTQRAKGHAPVHEHTDQPPASMSASATSSAQSDPEPALAARKAPPQRVECQLTFDANVHRIGDGLTHIQSRATASGASGGTCRKVIIRTRRKVRRNTRSSLPRHENRHPCLFILIVLRRIWPRAHFHRPNDPGHDLSQSGLRHVAQYAPLIRNTASSRRHRIFETPPDRAALQLLLGQMNMTHVNCCGRRAHPMRSCDWAMLIGPTMNSSTECSNFQFSSTVRSSSHLGAQNFADRRSGARYFAVAATRSIRQGRRRSGDRFGRSARLVSRH